MIGAGERQEPLALASRDKPDQFDERLARRFQENERLGLDLKKTRARIIQVAAL